MRENNIRNKVREVKGCEGMWRDVEGCEGMVKGEERGRE
jgi:hypothetical protein